MMPNFEKLLRKREVDAVAGKSLGFLKLHNGFGFRNPKVSFIAFMDGKPEFFMKSVRFREDNPIIQRAHERLEAAKRDVARSGAKANMPKPVWLESVAGFQVSAETMVPGRPLDWHDAIESANALAWLRNFSATARTGEYSGQDIEGLFRKIMTEFGVHDAEIAAYFDETFRRLYDAAGGQGLRLPRVPAHGDYTPSNILWDKGEMGIIDWDRYGDIDLPLFDLLTFVERAVGKSQNHFVVFKGEIISQAKTSKIGVEAVPLLVFFYVLLSDWRKREKMFNWESDQWNRDTYVLMQATLEKAEAVFSA